MINASVLPPKWWGWMWYDNPREAMPLTDEIEHISGMACPCKPDIVDGVIAHRALDGREAYEQRLRKPH